MDEEVKMGWYEIFYGGWEKGKDLKWGEEIEKKKCEGYEKDRKVGKGNLEKDFREK